jgi:hypothetical protein
MRATFDSGSRSRLCGELLESLIVEIRLANEACRSAEGAADQALADNRLQNALQVFDDLVFPGYGNGPADASTSCKWQ